MGKIINAIEKKINGIWDDIYATYWGLRLGVHLMVIRDMNKAVDDLFRLKKYFIKKHGSYTIWDHKDVLDMLNQVGSNHPENGF